MADSPGSTQSQKVVEESASVTDRVTRILDICHAEICVGDNRHAVELIVGMVSSMVEPVPDEKPHAVVITYVDRFKNSLRGVMLYERTTYQFTARRGLMHTPR